MAEEKSKLYKGVSYYYCPVCNKWEMHIGKSRHAFFFKCNYCHMQTKHIRGLKKFLQWWGELRGLSMKGIGG